MADTDPKGTALDDPVTRDIVHAIFDGLSASAAHTQSIMDSLWANDAAEAHWLRHGIEWALSTIPHGDTTAKYEAGLQRIQMVMYPPDDVREFYREHAARYIKGEGGEIPRHPRYRAADGYA